MFNIFLRKNVIISYSLEEFLKKFLRNIGINYYILKKKHSKKEFFLVGFIGKVSFGFLCKFLDEVPETIWGRQSLRNSRRFLKYSRRSFSKNLGRNSFCLLGHPFLFKYAPVLGHFSVPKVVCTYCCVDMVHFENNPRLPPDSLNGGSSSS